MLRLLMNGAMTVVESCDTMIPSLEFFELNKGNVWILDRERK